MNDQYLGIKVPISRNDTTPVLRRKMNSDETLIRTKHTNPILDGRVHEVDFTNGSRCDLATNIIVRHLIDSALKDGDHYTYIDSIVDIKSTEDAILKYNWYFTTPSYNKRRVITTED